MTDPFSMVQGALPEPAANAVRFVHYESAGPTPGRIVQTGYCTPPDLIHQVVHGCARLDGVTADLAADYVSDGRVLPRPALPGFDKTSIAANGIDTATMAVPVGCIVVIDSVPHVIADGALDLTADHAGSYAVAIDHWPYLPYRAAITCG